MKKTVTCSRNWKMTVICCRNWKMTVICCCNWKNRNNNFCHNNHSIRVNKKVTWKRYLQINISNRLVLKLIIIHNPIIQYQGILYHLMVGQSFQLIEFKQITKHKMKIRFQNNLTKSSRSMTKKKMRWSHKSKEDNNCHHQKVTILMSFQMNQFLKD